MPLKSLYIEGNNFDKTEIKMYAIIIQAIILKALYINLIIF